MGPQKARNHAKFTQNHGFLWFREKLAFGGQEPPKTPKRRPKKPPGRPQRGREQPTGKRDPRAKSDPKGRPGSPTTGQPAPQEPSKWPSGGPKWVPREARERPKKGPGEAQHTTQEDTRAEKPRQEDTRGDKTTEDKARGKTRQQTDKRSSGAAKPRTPWPISNLLLVLLMHGSTLVYMCV